jgi:hypothetical protein
MSFEKTVIKVMNPSGDFVCLPRAFAQDHSISATTRSALLDTFSRSENWKTSVGGIMSINRFGRDVARRVLSEAEAAGYALNIKIRSGGKFSDSQWILSADKKIIADLRGEHYVNSPEPEIQATVKSTMDGSPGPGNQGLENSTYENKEDESTEDKTTKEGTPYSPPEGDGVFVEPSAPGANTTVEASGENAKGALQGECAAEAADHPSPAELPSSDPTPKLRAAPSQRRSSRQSRLFGPRDDLPPCTPKFEEAWILFPKIKGMSMSKRNAHRSWLNQGCEEIADEVIAGIGSYREWFIAERQRRPDTPLKHMQGWISERRWEGAEGNCDPENEGGGQHQQATSTNADRFNDAAPKIVDVHGTWISGMHANTVLDDIPGVTKAMVLSALLEASSCDAIKPFTGAPSEGRVLRWVKEYCHSSLSGRTEAFREEQSRFRSPNIHEPMRGCMSL